MRFRKITNGIDGPRGPPFDFKARYCSAIAPRVISAPDFMNTLHISAALDETLGRRGRPASGSGLFSEDLRR